tara:strand:+ start:241 stop:534 length:294 start_codon:yes stop_codon:yes gene_type:complete
MLNIVEAFNKEDQIQVGKYSFSFKKIIETVADQMGGAHIDKKVKDSDLILHSNDFLFGNLNVAERVIYDTSRKCIQAIEEIERYIESNNESTFIEAV